MNANILNINLKHNLDVINIIRQYQDQFDNITFYVNIIKNANDTFMSIQTSFNEIIKQEVSQKITTRKNDNLISIFQRLIALKDLKIKKIQHPITNQLFQVYKEFPSQVESQENIKSLKKLLFEDTPKYSNYTDFDGIPNTLQFETLKRIKYSFIIFAGNVFEHMDHTGYAIKKLLSTQLEDNDFQLVKDKLSSQWKIEKLKMSDDSFLCRYQMVKEFISAKADIILLQQYLFTQIRIQNFEPPYNNKEKLILKQKEQLKQRKQHHNNEYCTTEDRLKCYSHKKDILTSKQEFKVNNNQEEPGIIISSIKNDNIKDNIKKYIKNFNLNKKNELICGVYLIIMSIFGTVLYKKNKNQLVHKLENNSSCMLNNIVFESESI